MALYYVKLGLDDEAVEMLKYAPEYPTVYYWLAYLLKNNSPEQSRIYLDKANAMSARLVFPFSAAYSRELAHNKIKLRMRMRCLAMTIHSLLFTLAGH